MERALIACNKDLNTAFLRRPQQLAVFQINPTHVRRSDHLEFAERFEAGS